MPKVFAELVKVRQTLEDHYRDMQDIEFTVERGKLWMLQTRTGKRTAPAALKIAVALVAEGRISREDAIRRIEPGSLDQLLHPMLDPAAKTSVLARGLPASPGAASGKVVFSADEAEAAAARGDAVILVRIETSPEDIHGMNAAKGILTTRGGMTSHAAVVARGMGRPCVVGRRRSTRRLCKRYDGGAQPAGARRRSDHDQRLDRRNHGRRGADDPAAALRRFRDADGLGRRAAHNEGPRQRRDRGRCPRRARVSAPRGSGCRAPSTCFSKPTASAPMREMIMADEELGRRVALAKLLPMQRADFTEIFRIMRGLPVTIRLLDPPLHEFLPKTDAEFAEMAAAHRQECRRNPPAHPCALRSQPDARPARLPARHHLSRDLRDPGGGDLRGGGRGDKGDGRGGRA